MSGAISGQLLLEGIRKGAGMSQESKLVNSVPPCSILEFFVSGFLP